MEVSIESWGPDCGPRPRSSRSRGGGRVTIEQDGEALVLRSGGRVIRSDRCWSQNPSIRRTSGGRSDDSWVTRCNTPRDDPREEHGTYSLKLLAPGRLLYQDVSRFNWKLKDSTCTASITTVQTLMRSGAAPRTPAPSPLPLEEDPSRGRTTRAPKRASCEPGEPAQLSLRPGSVELELGGHICFRTRVVDGRGCRVPRSKVEWSLQSRPAAARPVLTGGCLQVGDNAAEAEGRYLVQARLGRLSARAEARVRAADLSSVMARHLVVGGLGNTDGGVVDAGGAPAEGEPARPATRTAARTLPRESAGGRWTWSLFAAALAALAVGALVWIRRRAHAALHLPPPGDADTHTEDGSAARDPSGRGAAPGAHVCPNCRRGYPAAGRCRHDGTPLVPYAEFTRSRDGGESSARRRCPRCGTLYPAGTAFCGEDGSPLHDVD
ncbi:MAG: zinc ribbon domain-containing protein [Myxococcales bacterium]